MAAGAYRRRRAAQVAGLTLDEIVHTKMGEIRSSNLVLGTPARRPGQPDGQKMSKIVGCARAQPRAKS